MASERAGYRGPKRTPVSSQESEARSIEFTSYFRRFSRVIRNPTQSHKPFTTASTSLRRLFAPECVGIMPCCTIRTDHLRAERIKPSESLETGDLGSRGTLPGTGVERNDAAWSCSARSRMTSERRFASVQCCFRNEERFATSSAKAASNSDFTASQLSGVVVIAFRSPSSQQSVLRESAAENQCSVDAQHCNGCMFKTGHFRAERRTSFFE